MDLVGCSRSVLDFPCRDLGDLDGRSNHVARALLSARASRNGQPSHRLLRYPRWRQRPAGRAVWPLRAATYRRGDHSASRRPSCAGSAIRRGHPRLPLVEATQTPRRAGIDWRSVERLQPYAKDSPAPSRAPSLSARWDFKLRQYQAPILASLSPCHPGQARSAPIQGRLGRFLVQCRLGGGGAGPGSRFARPG